MNQRIALTGLSVIVLLFTAATSLVSPNDTALAAAALTATPLPNPLEEPLPTPGRIPVSAWRPPLYAIPWGLTDHDHFYFARPIAADRPNWPLPYYRYAGTNFGVNSPHTGVDMTAPIGTSVLAAADGKVVWTGYGLYGGGFVQDDPYGIAVMLEHDFSFDGQRLYSVYAHLSESLVTTGQQVNRGDIIALSGDTGFATDAHLHFEVRMGGDTFFHSYNPELWMSPPQGWGVLAGRVTDGFGVLRTEVDVHVVSLDTGKTFLGKTYGTNLTINRDPYYQENYVLSDLPAGDYQVLIKVDETIWYDTEVTILPGAVTFFNLWGYHKINVAQPAEPRPGNLPATPTADP